MTLSVNATVAASASVRNTIDLGSSSASRAVTAALALTDGTAAGQADLCFTDVRTLAASGTESLDLAGALADPFGVAQVFARVKLLVITADADNGDVITVSRPASNGAPIFDAASDAVSLRPGGFLVLGTGAADAVGIAVTAGTGDLVAVTNGDSSDPASYSIMVVGCSA